MQEKTKLIILKITVLLSVLFAYQHSYDNAFHFDDAHTIVDNPYIRDVSNLGMFFTDGAKTFSSLPTNQVYRPVISAVLAIDYWLSEQFYDNGYDTHIYHYTIMLAYLVLLFLLYFFFKKIFELSNPHPWNEYFVIFATAFFGLHTVNAETVNYVIACSDLYSTLFVVASFVVFMYFPNKRKLGLFLIPFALGMLVKLTTAMFIPMLFVYYMVFEFLPLNSQKRKAMLKSVLIYGAILSLIMIVFTKWVMAMASDTFVPSGLTMWSYLITMPGVLLHYVISFFYPYNLSADTDWQVIPDIWNLWFFAGMIFLAAMGFLFFKTFNKLKYAPIAFGIAWFYIALAPTSSLIPLAEVLNDHRMFFPFVGMMLAVVYAISLYITGKQYVIIENKLFKYILLSSVAIVLIAHIIGTRHRTEVWDSGRSLWYDVTIQSPNNGRGLMNYGLILMGEGENEKAMEYYQKALILGPKYSYLHTNMGICYNAMGNTKMAEYHFGKAIEYGYYAHKTHYYYSRYLMEHKRYKEAIEQLNLSLNAAPEYIFSMHELMKVYIALDDWDNLEEIAARSLALYPKDIYSNYCMEIAKGRMTKLDMARNLSKTNPSEDNFINLSLEYYNAEKYDSSAWAATQTLEINDSNELAYNNICAAYNMIEKYKLAIEAGEKAVTLNPENQLAKNNLNLALNKLQIQEKINSVNNFDALINLSLEFYNQKMYYSCIMACEKAVKYDGNSTFAYNNICSAYNSLHKYEQAVAAGEKAVEADSSNKLAKNNLAYARKMLNNK